MAYIYVSIVGVVLIVLSLTPSPFSHQPYTYVRADDELIRRGCHNAEVPETCIQCLKSDHRGEAADIVGIVTIVVDCLSNHASILQGNMSSLASKEQVPASKQVYVDCTDWFSYAKQGLYAATLGLKNREYDSADRSVHTALMYRVACGSEIAKGSSDINMPQEVLYEMIVYEELSQAAMRIIDRL